MSLARVLSCLLGGWFEFGLGVAFTARLVMSCLVWVKSYLLLTWLVVREFGLGVMLPASQLIVCEFGLSCQLHASLVVNFVLVVSYLLA